MMLRIPTGKHVLHESLRANDFDIQGFGHEWDPNLANLLSLPALLNAVIDKCHETGRDNDTVALLV